MLAELDVLYNMGYRGHLDFVDDNFIGNKKSLRLFLRFFPNSRLGNVHTTILSSFRQKPQSIWPMIRN